jgi:hypothetical protein
MKRMILVLVVLAIAVPSFGGVGISLEKTKYGFDVKYDASAEPNLVRAFAIKVDVGTSTITAVTPTKKGESKTSTGKGYGIFPGTITINGSGVVTDDGTPVAPAGDPGAGAVLPTNMVVLELGSLYRDRDVNAPGKTGKLCAVTVSGLGTTTVTEEPIRGGIVMENPLEDPVVTMPAALRVGHCQDYNITKKMLGLADNVVNVTDVQKFIDYVNVNKISAAVWVVSTTPVPPRVYDVRYNYSADTPVINVADLQALITWVNTFKISPAVWVVQCP